MIYIKKQHLTWHVVVMGCARSKMRDPKHTANKNEHITNLYIINVGNHNDCQIPRGDDGDITDERQHLRCSFEYLHSDWDKRIAIYFVQLVYFAFLDSSQIFFQASTFFVFFVHLFYTCAYSWYQGVDRICLSSNVSENYNTGWLACA